MRDYHNYSFGGGFRGVPPVGLVTRRLLIANVAISMLLFMRFGSSSGSEGFVGLFGLSWQGLSRGMFWQPVTYMFLHGGLWHLVGNMLGLFFFGRELELRLGRRNFLWLYFGGGILGALGWLALGAMGFYSLAYPMIGASGAVFAIVGAYAAIYPQRQVTLLLFFVIPVTMTARTMALVFGGVSVLMLGDGGRIAHAAHLGGGVAGYLYGLRVARGGLRYGAAAFTGASPHWRLRDWIARLRRSRLRVYRAPDEKQPVDWDRIDAILLKIKERGFGALSVAERAALDRASRAAERDRR